MLVGEKHVDVDQWGVGGSTYADGGAYNGDGFNSMRFAGPGKTLARIIFDNSINIFGSHHPGVCQFVLCDGSVKAIPVTVNAATLGWLAARADGEVVSLDQ
ncbi:hypothetical protein Enr8_49580 [Blastopirellula retiformator]|uniref:DUF1559 domain-containing protein n=1 Tax=Blastopirellula retiformator TaxID=2527970 RepID=A0A5C5UVK7_9BACT|nr:hypothetical protein Enr8_49580 [Blastopirellula retiformator]